jgi:hypothetical protein
MFNAPIGANMETATLHGTDSKEGAAGPAIVALTAETRAAVDTATAAFHLNRRPQTLRGWACLENGPLRPMRVHGRLAWPVAELRRVLGVEVAQ